MAWYWWVVLSVFVVTGIRDLWLMRNVWEMHEEPNWFWITLSILGYPFVFTVLIVAMPFGAAWIWWKTSPLASAVRGWAGIIWGLLVAIGICLGLLAWALWQDTKVRFFRLIRAKERANRIQAKADRDLRQFCGVSEQDGDYYGCGFPG